MKKKDTVDYRAYTVKDLMRNLLGKRDELFNLKLDHSQGKLSNTSSLFKKRKEIARILTLVKEKSLTLSKQEVLPAGRQVTK